MPPKKATLGRKRALVAVHDKGATPSTNIKTTANAPPDDTPSNAGSAKGFLNIPCITVPARASEAPVAAAIKSRGSLISSRIILIVLSADCSVKPNTEKRSCQLVATVPCLIESNKDNGNSSIRNKINLRRAVVARGNGKCTARTIAEDYL